MLPHAVGGASSGSIVAAALALGRSQDLEDGWLSLMGITRVLQPGVVLRGGWPLRMSHILRPALEEQLGDVSMRDAGLPLAIPVTLPSRRGRVERMITRADDVSVVDAILASCFIPGIYSRPVWIDGRPALDGAWLRRVPEQGVRALGVERVVAMTDDPSGLLRGGLFRPRVESVHPNTRVLSPLINFPLRGFDFDPGRTRAAMAIGRASAADFLTVQREWLFGDTV